MQISMDKLLFTLCKSISTLYMESFALCPKKQSFIDFIYADTMNTTQII